MLLDCAMKFTAYANNLLHCHKPLRELIDMQTECDTDYGKV